MKRYEYKVPPGKKSIISHRTWNKHLGKRGRSPLTHVEAYEDEDRVICHHVISLLGKATIAILLPVLFPIAVCLSGVVDAYQEMKEIFFQKKLGKFSSDSFDLTNEKQRKQWKKIKK